MNTKGKLNTPVGNRHDFVLLIEKKELAKGIPGVWIDEDTGFGFLTAWWLKRKLSCFVRDQNLPECHIYFDPISRRTVKEAAPASYTGTGELEELSKHDPRAAQKIGAWMCRNFWDIRSFGAGIATVENGEERIPDAVQIGIARSVTQVMRKNGSFSPRNLYRYMGYISPFWAKSNGFSEMDLGLLWKAMLGMTLDNRSRVHSLIIFEHQSPYGNCPQEQIRSSLDITSDENEYFVTLDKEKIPESVQVSVLQGNVRYKTA